MSKILVVDDSMVIRKMINRSLEGSNHEVVEAENGQEGLDHFMNDHFDLVITDINMPILNGFEFIEKLRKSDHEKKDLPIIVVSTEFSDDVKAQGKSLGVNAWMVKPTDDKLLNEAVTVLIARSQA